MLFQVIKSPEGTSPQWVRDAWVGVKFQALQGAPVSMPTLAASARTGLGAQIMGKPSGKNTIIERQGYVANARDVLGLLALVNQDAAQWYINNSPQMLNPEQVFLFDESHCVAIAHLSDPAP